MTLSPASTSSFLTIPLALDFTSTLVMGVTLPVATTLLARSPFSTFCSFEGSILVPPRVAAISPPGDQEDEQESNTAIDQPFPSLLAAAIPVHICLLKCNNARVDR